jgi:hypothetical protein
MARMMMTYRQIFTQGGKAKKKKRERGKRRRKAFKFIELMSKD